MAELKVCNVSKSFDGRKIIEDISLELKEGELVSLLGTSGGGKTTLFNIIAGLYEPDEGEVLLDGNHITGQTGRVSYMLQKDLLLPYKTIEDNVALPLILKGTPKTEARAEAGKYFQEFGLSGTEKKYPHQLSGGMRQRAALLRTYMFSSEIALFMLSVKEICFPSEIGCAEQEHSRRSTVKRAGSPIDFLIFRRFPPCEPADRPPPASDRPVQSQCAPPYRRSVHRQSPDP